MKLFLSSYRAGNHADRLVGLFGIGAKVVVVSNAKDYKSEAERQQSIDDFLRFLRELGFDVVDLDLRKYFGKTTDWAAYLAGFDAVWLAGGNTFVLRRALAKAGFDNAVIEYVRADKIAYGGESAGAIMATPDFIGVEFGDDPHVLPAGYSEPTPKTGLSLVGYDIVPHYQSEWAGAAEMEAALRKAGKAFKTLTDTQVIIVDDDHVEVLT